MNTQEAYQIGMGTGRRLKAALARLPRGSEEVRASAASHPHRAALCAGVRVLCPLRALRPLGPQPCSAPLLSQYIFVWFFPHMCHGIGCAGARSWLGGLRSEGSVRGWTGVGVSVPKSLGPALVREQGEPAFDSYIQIKVP